MAPFSCVYYYLFALCGCIDLVQRGGNDGMVMIPSPLRSESQGDSDGTILMCLFLFVCLVWLYLCVSVSM